MKEPHIVRAIAISLVLFSLINIGGSILVSGDERLVSNCARLIAICVLAFFLARGTSWARWLTVIFCTLGIVAGIFMALALPGSEIDHKTARVAWVVTGISLNTIIVGLLAFSSRISNFFSPTTLRTRVFIGLIVGGLLIVFGVLTYLDIQNMHDYSQSTMRTSYPTQRELRQSCEIQKQVQQVAAPDVE